MKQKGFTLLELMIVVVIVAILAAIAIPSYQSYVRRTNEGLAIQEMQRIVILLERSKARNFSYQSFSLDPNRKIPPVYVSVLANGYIIRVADGSSTTKAADLSTSSGQSWAIQAMAPSSDTQQYSLLLTSNGLRCKNKASSNVTFSTCGTGSENW